jgi:DNA-binding NarL/FixJ family response regulator
MADAPSAGVDVGNEEMARTRQPRVLIADFGGIGGVGLESLLRAEGLDFETCRPTAGGLIADVVARRPDVVVLDRQMPQAFETAERIAAAHPRVRVVVCSLDDTVMSVFPPDGADAYESPLDAPRLAAAIRERP